MQGISIYKFIYCRYLPTFYCISIDHDFQFLKCVDYLHNINRKFKALDFG